MIIFDIGACIGIFIDDCLAKYGGDIEMIYAFEPLFVNNDFLCEKYKDNPKVTIYSLAVGAKGGLATFYKKFDPRTDSQSGSDYVGNAGSSLKKGKYNVSSHFKTEVRVITLSKFLEVYPEIEKIDILKIDTEGSEYDILEDINTNLTDFEFGSILFEDHVGKVAGLESDRERVLTEIKKKDKGGLYKVQTQGNHLEYTPLEESTIWKEL